MSTRMFDELSENWQLVISRMAGKIIVEANFKDGFVCPICFKLFRRDQITELSQEHVPPKSLGGKPITLACKNCNNSAGYALEHHWIKLAELEAISARPTDKIISILATVNDKIRLPLRFQQSAEKEFRIFPSDKIIKTKSELVERFTREILLPDSKLSITMESVDQNRKRIAILKSAYLHAFTELGYIFALNPNIQKMRQQILEPDQPIWTQKSFVEYFFPDEMLGINLLTHPRKLRSFLVVFDTIIEGHAKRYGVFFPGFTEPGLNIYDALLEESGNVIDFKAKTFLSMPMNDYPLRAYEVWLDFNN